MTDSKQPRGSNEFEAGILKRIETTRQKLKAVPQSAVFYNELAISLGTLARMDEAIATLRQAIAIKPTFGEAWRNLAVALQALGRNVEALEAATTACRLVPAFDVAREQAAALSAAMGLPFERDGWPEPGLFRR